MEQGYMNLVVSFLGDSSQHVGNDDIETDEFSSSPDFLLNTNYRERAFSWDLTFENQINNMEGAASSFDNGIFVFPRNRSESISALSDIIRGVRSDSFADACRARSDSLTDSAFFLPLLVESVPEVVATSVKVKVAKETLVPTPAPQRAPEVREFRYTTLQTPMVEVFSTDTRVGAYSREERQLRITRFRDKKKKRVWRKQIKYDCRKRLADTRPRIKGRFVSRKEDGGADDSELNEFIAVLAKETK